MTEQLAARVEKLINRPLPRVKQLPYLKRGITEEPIEKNEKGFAVFRLEGIGAVEAEVKAVESIPQYGICTVIHRRSPIKVRSSTPRVWKVIEKSKTITLEGGESEELELSSTTNCNQVLLLIDDGQGGDPATYDIEFYHYNTPQSVYMLHSSYTDETSRSWEDAEPTDQWKAILTKSGKGTATYRLFAQGKRI
nr:hypothetical protein [uncultured bacterium]